MRTYHWMIMLMVVLTVITAGMFLSDLKPRHRMPALAVMVVATGILLILASMIFSRL